MYYIKIISLFLLGVKSVKIMFLCLRNEATLVAEPLMNSVWKSIQ